MNRLDRTYTRSQKSVKPKENVKNRRDWSLRYRFIWIVVRDTLETRCEAGEGEERESSAKGDVLRASSKYTELTNDPAGRICNSFFSPLFSRATVGRLARQRTGSLIHLSRSSFHESVLLPRLTRLAKRDYVLLANVNETIAKQMQSDILNFFKFLNERKRRKMLINVYKFHKIFFNNNMNHQ